MKLRVQWLAYEKWGKREAWEVRTGQKRHGVGAEIFASSWVHAHAQRCARVCAGAVASAHNHMYAWRAVDNVTDADVVEQQKANNGPRRACSFRRNCTASAMLDRAMLDGSFVSTDR